MPKFTNADHFKNACYALSKELLDQRKPEAAKRVIEASILLNATPDTTDRLVSILIERLRKGDR